MRDGRINFNLKFEIDGGVKAAPDADQYTARERALLNGAVRYFVENDDVKSDLASPTRFEDDAQILNAVCAYLGRSGGWSVIP